MDAHLELEGLLSELESFMEIGDIIADWDTFNKRFF